jgi:hypothetical protein
MTAIINEYPADRNHRPAAAAALFHRAARALFGDHYIAPISEALKVDKNTVNKWRNACPASRQAFGWNSSVWSTTESKPYPR